MEERYRYEDKAGEEEDEEDDEKAKTHALKQGKWALRALFRIKT